MKPPTNKLGSNISALIDVYRIKPKTKPKIEEKEQHNGENKFLLLIFVVVVVVVVVVVAVSVKESHILLAYASVLFSPKFTN